MLGSVTDDQLKVARASALALFTGARGVGTAGVVESMAKAVDKVLTPSLALIVWLPPRLVRAGNTYEFGQPLKPGDIINTRSRIADVYGRQGASGNMIFIICQSEYSNQRGEALGKSGSTIIVWG